MIRDREHECMSREGLKQLQGERLVTLVNRVYSRVPFYRDLFDKAGVKPEEPVYFTPKGWPGNAAPEAGIDPQGRVYYAWQSAKATSPDSPFAASANSQENERRP